MTHVEKHQDFEDDKYYLIYSSTGYYKSVTLYRGLGEQKDWNRMGQPYVGFSLQLISRYYINLDTYSYSEEDIFRVVSIHNGYSMVDRKGTAIFKLKDMEVIEHIVPSIL